MPQDGLFFRIVRRFFLLFGTLASLVILAFVGYGIWHVWTSGFHPAPSPYGAPPFGTARTVTYAIQLQSLETPEPLASVTPASSDYRLYVLNRVSWPTTLPDFNPIAATNVMLIDEKTGSGKWLFKGTKRNIFARHGVREGKLDREAATDKRPIVGLVLLVDESDANASATPVLDETESVFYWRLDRPEAVKLLEGVRGVAHGQLESGYNIVYKKGGKTVSVMYSIPDFKVISETTLPEP